MSVHFLPQYFALQSTLDEPLAVSWVSADGHGLAILIEGNRYPYYGLVDVHGLLPGRHYVLTGADHRFCRADAMGVAQIAVQLRAPALLTLAPVI